MKKSFWFVLCIPSFNIMIMYLIKFFENTYYCNFDMSTNWILQFVFIMAGVIGNTFHYIFSILIPIFVYKVNKQFTNKEVTVSTISIILANLFMFGFELLRTSFDETVYCVYKPFLYTMLITVIFSEIINIKAKWLVMYNRLKEINANKENGEDV